MIDVLHKFVLYTDLGSSLASKFVTDKITPSMAFEKPRKQYSLEPHEGRCETSS